MSSNSGAGNNSPPTGTGTSNTNNAVPTTGTPTSRTQGRRTRTNRFRQGQRNTNAFRGDTEGMNGHVFQTFQESRDRRQFLKTMEALGHYINKNMKFGSDLTVLYKHLRLPTIAKPSADGLDLVNNPADKIEWAETYKIYVSRRRELEDNLRNVYAVAWGQCSEPMKAKLQSFAEFEDKDGVCDCVWLLTSIRAVTYKFDEQRDVCLSLCEARWLLESKRQQPQDTDAAHFEDFKTLVDTYEHFGGSIGADSGLLCELRNEHKNDKDSPGPIPTLDQSDPSGSYVALCDYYQRLDMFEEKLKQIAKARTLATMFLRSLDKHRYGPLLTDLHNQHSRGNYQYPQDLSAAYALILTYESPTRPPPRPRGPDRTRTSLLLKLRMASPAATVSHTQGLRASIVTDVDIMPVSVPSPRIPRNIRCSRSPVLTFAFL